MFIGNYWHLLTIPEHCRWQREKYKWIKHKSFKDSFILLLLWVGTECKFPSSRKTSCPNTQEILLLALHKAVKEEAKLAASDELKASQEVQDSKGFHTLQTWDSGETACPTLCRESRKQASTQKISHSNQQCFRAFRRSHSDLFKAFLFHVKTLQKPTLAS